MAYGDRVLLSRKRGRHLCLRSLGCRVGWSLQPAPLFMVRKICT